MSQDKEHEVRLQFLEKAQDYLNNIESGLLGIGTQGVDKQGLDPFCVPPTPLKVVQR